MAFLICEGKCNAVRWPRVEAMAARMHKHDPLPCDLHGWAEIVRGLVYTEHRGRPSVMTCQVCGSRRQWGMVDTGTEETPKPRLTSRPMSA
jgi:hypothetical protein